MTKQELWERSIRYKEYEGHISDKCDFCDRKLNDGDKYLIILNNYYKNDYFFDIKDTYIICKECFLEEEDYKTLYEGFYCKTCNSCENTILSLGKESFDKNQLVYYCKKCERNWI